MKTEQSIIIHFSTVLREHAMYKNVVRLLLRLAL